MRDLGINEKQITLICLLGSPEGVQAISEKYPNIKLFLGTMDESLNENAYILPGLGDAGDRSFGTMA
jgi:uracil phosphoribosyltransferase